MNLGQVSNFCQKLKFANTSMEDGNEINLFAQCGITLD